MKTEPKSTDLIGEALDWAVATTQGAIVEQQSGGPTWMVAGAMLGYTRSYCPSTDDEQAGPIIDKEHIPTWKIKEGWAAAKPKTSGYKGYGYIDLDEFTAGAVGPTRLVAAMRCFVNHYAEPVVKLPEKST